MTNQIKLLLFLCFALFCSQNLSAQRSLKSTKNLNNKFTKQTATNSLSKTQIPNSSKNKSNTIASNIELNTHEEKLNVSNYRIDFPSNPYADKQKAVCYMHLYSSKDQQIGTINFYTDSAKDLGNTTALDKNNFVTMFYHIDMLPAIEKMVTTSRKVVIVYDEKNKTAYLSSDIQMTRSR